MNTKILMTASAVFLATVGILLSFLPDEIAEYLHVEQHIITVLFLQIMGALYLGFALMNWMAKGTLIGGIYNRPMAIANFMHFAVGSITLLKVVADIQTHREVFLFLAAVYLIFAISFAYVFRTNPSKSVK